MEQMGGPSEMMLKMKMEVHVYGVLPVGIIPGTADGACMPFARPSSLPLRHCLGTHSTIRANERGPGRYCNCARVRGGGVGWGGVERNEMKRALPPETRGQVA